VLRGRLGEVLTVAHGTNEDVLGTVHEKRGVGREGKVSRVQIDSGRRVRSKEGRERTASGCR
jgi:hypothetical protein